MKVNSRKYHKNRNKTETKLSDITPSTQESSKIDDFIVD